MKSLNNYLEYVLLILVSILSISPLILDSILIAVALILSILILFINKDYDLKPLKKYYPLLILFLIYVIGGIYSENIDKAFFQIQKKMSLVLFPIIFITIKKEFFIKKIISWFSFGLLISSFLTDVIALILNGKVTFYSDLTRYLTLDPTYYCIYAIPAIVFFVNRLSSQKNRKKTIIYIISLAYLLFFYLRIGSKIGLILLVVTAILLLFYHAKTIKQVTSIFIVLLLLITTSYFLPISYNRFYKPFVDYGLDFYQLRMRFFYERYYTWRCSLEAINLKSLFFGYGTGDDLGVLNTCYEKYRRSFRFNSHNIYFSALLKHGLLGLLSLIFILYKCLKNKRLWVKSLVLTIIIVGFTESILERHKGLVFFALFCTIIIRDNYFNKKECVE